MYKTKHIILMAVLFILSLPVYVMAGAVDLPKTGQTACYNSAGTEILCTGTGQDGDLQKGVSWPSPRFTDNIDGTVTDNLTGLVWTKDGDASGPIACPPISNTMWTWWGDALNYVACLNVNNYLGHSDWRLPNINELKSLTHAGQYSSPAWLEYKVFNNVYFGELYSSTTFAFYPNWSWSVTMWNGYVDSRPKTTTIVDHVWPVRTGLHGSSIIQLPRTGQTTCHDTIGITIACAGTGQDGDKQAGVPWPNPRFTDNGDGTVTDNLTGLEWIKDAWGDGIIGCSLGSYDKRRWEDALSGVICLNDSRYLGHSDWRMPNINELKSLINYGQSDSASWLNTQGFVNLLGWFYWSSTSDWNKNYLAYVVDMVYGDVGARQKMDFGVLLPVRTGTNLIVSTLTAPNTASPGQSITLTESTKNQGTAGAGASTTKYYWPSNPNPVLIGSRSVPALTAGATSSGTTAVTIPSFTCSGMKTFYIKAAADADGVIAESDETNNNKWRAVKMGPDLIIPTLTAPNNAGAGKTINISDTVKNNGGCTAGASTTKLYFSLDAILDAGDTLLGSRAVPLLTAGATSSGTTAVTIPAGTATGKYYIIAYSDADNVVAETFEGNNKKVKVINILPDLIVSILSVPNTAGAGAVIAISDTTKNIGGSSAAASTTSFYFSTDTILNAGDTLLGIRAIPALAAGTISSGTTRVTIPVGTVSGTYYIIGRSDADAVVPETNEGNNNKSRLITVP